MGRLMDIIAQEGLLNRTGGSIPSEVEDLVTTDGEYDILWQSGGRFLTDGGAYYKTGTKFAAWDFGGDLEAAARSIRDAEAKGRTYVPRMKTFRSKKDAMSWLGV